MVKVGASDFLIMSNISLETPLAKLPGIGPKNVKKLKKIGLETIQALLFYFPFRYDDFSRVVPISQASLGQVSTIKGRILEIANVTTFRKKMVVTQALISDESGTIKAIWFNQPYLIRNLRKGTKISVSGKVSYAEEGLQFSNPAYEIIREEQRLAHTGRLVPVYHETYDLSSRWLRFHIQPLLALTSHVQDFLPWEIKNKFRLLDLANAIRQIHFPKTLLGANQAKRRLAFDELFLIELFVLSQKRNWQKFGALIIPFTNEIKKIIQDFVKKLPFKLTNAQKISAWQILQDLAKPFPMNRLLEGDVGSGKTLVAAIAALACIKSDYQVAIMAPTEILSFQHFEEFKKLLKDFDSTIGLITSSRNAISNSPAKITRQKIFQDVKNGDINIVIGTHALLSEKIKFKNLALVIIDEQHRFGIEQRANLVKKTLETSSAFTKFFPHFLTMSATPIPRTLFLTIYGDLDISVIDQMPQGRQKIITKVVSPQNRPKAYEFIKNQIRQGRQVFVICPLIEESEKLEAKAATEEYHRLQRDIFPEFKIGLLHGRLKPKEKEKIMKDFFKKKFDILVSTSIVEVGINIINATVMMIEGAERFGLAQLHQFRGRVGRSKYQSYCFLFTDSPSKKTQARLKAILNSKDCFELAEYDLKIRGPGEFLGIRQSGLPDLAMASLRDVSLISKARQAAQIILEKSPTLKVFPPLAQKFNEFKNKVHIE